MTYTFYKYQGTGNDFILIDNRQHLVNKNNTKLFRYLCDRRFGIGADGLILLENDELTDFKMVYFNSDGNESTMCGNGGRCLTAFAHYLGIIENKARFQAVDGIHDATIDDEIVNLQMQDVDDIRQFSNHIYLNTGSPHHVQLEKNLDDLDINTVGAKIRFGVPYIKDGVNVNFVNKINTDSFAVRTYERGVEGETLSCGTGVTAVAIAMNYIGETEKNLINLKTKGGNLQVSFEKNGKSYRNVCLIGPAKMVFKGTMEW